MFRSFDHHPYTDIYFLRSLEILRAEGLNPYARAQVFFRQGPHLIAGVEEAIQFIEQCSQLKQHGGHVWALASNMQFQPLETVLLIEGHVQDFITLETVLLGILSSQTTLANGGTLPDPSSVTKHVREVCEAVQERPVMYFGARHWHYSLDAEISAAAFAGGATGASTSIGAAQAHQQPLGTIPHSLENVFAWKYGKERAVLEATLAFDRHIDPQVQRVALVDYANREVDDALAVAQALGKKLSAVRIDTSGDHSMQGAQHSGGETPGEFWYGNGVSISGVAAVRAALDHAGFPDVGIVLSSGFGNIDKVRAFVAAEKKLDQKLFRSLGVGEVFPAITATMDIVGLGADEHSLEPIAKVGRAYSPNPRLQPVF